MFWIASDWPLATLGGAYLLSAHVVIYMLYTFGAAPLLLLGIRPWMARAVIDRAHAWGLYRTVTTPWVAAVQINAVLVITHLPPVVDTAAGQPARFVRARRGLDRVGPDRLGARWRDRSRATASASRC